MESDGSNRRRKSVELDLEFIPCCPLAWLLGLLLEIFCGDMTGHTAPDYRQPAPSAAEHMALKQKYCGA
jgi:hypothetical protein